MEEYAAYPTEKAYGGALVKAIVLNYLIKYMSQGEEREIHILFSSLQNEGKFMQSVFRQFAKAR